MIKLAINVQNLITKNGQTHLKIALELANVLRSLIFTSKYLKRIHLEPQNLTREGELLQALIVSASYVYEAINFLNTICRKLNPQIQQEAKNEIAWLRNEGKNPNSFQNKVLYSIRNNLGFHFLNAFNVLDIKKALDQTNSIFMATEHEYLIDSSFPVLDNLIDQYLAYLAKKVGFSEATSDAIINNIFDYTNETYGKLFEIMKALLGDQLIPKTEPQK